MVYAWFMYCILQLCTYDMTLLTYQVFAPFTCRFILIEQSRLLCFQLSENLLCVSEREHLASVMQLLPGTPAACTLCCGAHSGHGHLITVHGLKSL